MWVAESGEGRHEIDAPAVGDAGSKFLHVNGSFDDAEPIAEPLDDRTADKDASFERVVCPGAEPPRYRGEQFVPRDLRFGADVHQHEATCAVGVFREAALDTILPEQGGLLIAGHTGDLNRRAEERGLAIDLARRTDLGKQ